MALEGTLPGHLALRMTLPPSSIVDVPYRRLSAAPLEEVPRLYAAIGAPWTATDHENLAAVVARPAGTTAHRYDLGLYVDPERAAETFAPYNRLLDRLDLRAAEPAVEL